MVSGIDILTAEGQKGLEADLKKKVKHIDQISHIFFFGTKRPVLA
jgi:hypothetical protein